MSAVQLANGVTRYVSVGLQPTTSPQRVNIPPLAKRFVGEPAVSLDVLPSGRVHFYVQQPVKLLERGVTVNDIYRVTVPRIKKPFVKHYPKPISLTRNVGPGAPVAWPSDKTIPEEVHDLIAAAANELLANTDVTKMHAVQDALSRLGIGTQGVAVPPRMPMTIG